MNPWLLVLIAIAIGVAAFALGRMVVAAPVEKSKDSKLPNVAIDKGVENAQTGPLDPR